MVSITFFTQVLVCLEASISRKKPRACTVSVFTMSVLFKNFFIFFFFSLASDDRTVKFKIASDGKSTGGISSIIFISGHRTTIMTSQTPMAKWCRHSPFSITSPGSNLTNIFSCSLLFLFFY